MKKIKLITINKATGDKVWYKDLVGSLFLVSDCSSKTYLNVVRPIVGESNQLQVDASFCGYGVVLTDDVQVITELNII